MPHITVLTEDVINKIAAGEVIERPASVVKELVENALDAHATRIIVEIKWHGKELIRVTDNGEGMDEEDAQNCILRHATSKIKDTDDLFAITTLGFRGEALSSIAAVSRLTLRTKQKEKMEGIQISVEGGVLSSQSFIAMDQGTSMEIRDLFYNTPARKKFLKTDTVELRHIIDVVSRYALLHPTIALTLRHEGRELVHSPSVEDMRSNIASLYGILLAKELLEVQYDEQGIKVDGFISPPYRTRGDKSLKELFVNGRWVRNEDIMNAVYEGYHAALFVGTHPVVFLQVDVDPRTIDVNVHPTKAEIKIEQKEKVCEAVSRAVRQALEKNNIIPQVNPMMEQQATLGAGMPSVLKSSAAGESYYSFEPSAQTVFRVAEGAAAMMPPEDLGNHPNYSIEQEEITWKQPISMFPALRLLGQVHKTFFVAETLGGVYYIDQHAAHERVLYERFMEQYLKQGVEVQQLLQGEIIQFTAAETAVVEEQREELEQFGFQLEPFGTNTFVLKTIPLLFGRQQRKEVLYDVLEMLKERKQKIGEAKEEIITRMACRAAVMAGEELTIVEMEHILRELGETQFPFTCPHGRPTILKVSVEELQKKFKRI